MDTQWRDQWFWQGTPSRWISAISRCVRDPWFFNKLTWLPLSHCLYLCSKIIRLQHVITLSRCHQTFRRNRYIHFQIGTEMLLPLQCEISNRKPVCPSRLLNIALDKGSRSLPTSGNLSSGDIDSEMHGPNLAYHRFTKIMFYFTCNPTNIITWHSSKVAEMFSSTVLSMQT